MKKFTIFILSVFFLLLVPTSTFAYQSRLIAVRMGGGTCNGTVTVVTDHFNAGGQRRISVSLVGPGGITIGTSRVTSDIGNQTLNWQFNSNGYVVANAVLRVWVGFDGQYRQYYFDCFTMELSGQTVTAFPNYATDLQRNTTYDLNVIANDASELPIVSVTVLPFTSTVGTATIVDHTTVRLTTANRIGTFTIRYRACNLANNCGEAAIIFSIANVAPTCDAVQNTVYYWPRNQVEAPFIGNNGVEDPEGDPLTLQITSLTNAGASGDGGILYDIEFTVEDVPPFPGTPLTCSGTARVRKEE